MDAEHGAHASRRRRTPWTAGVVVVGLLAGGLFVASAQQAQSQSRPDRGDLVSLVDREQARNRVLEAQVKQLSKQVQALTASRGAADQQVAMLTSSANLIGPDAGTAAVRGQVLEVTLDDAPRSASLDSRFKPDDLVVHQQDVQAVVNALWHGHAEAMMLMDQRVISTSAVRCVGNTLILQGRVYSPPYRIRAMGDPQKMLTALAASPDVQIYQEFVAAAGLGYTVQSLGRQTFPGYDGSLQLRYARVQP